MHGTLAAQPQRKKRLSLLRCWTNARTQKLNISWGYLSRRTTDGIQGMTTQTAVTFPAILEQTSLTQNLDCNQRSWRLEERALAAALPIIWATYANRLR